MTGIFSGKDDRADGFCEMPHGGGKKERIVEPLQERCGCKKRFTMRGGDKESRTGESGVGPSPNMRCDIPVEGAVHSGYWIFL